MDKQFCIFDMDGTLVDSMGYWKRLGREFLAQKGVTENVEPVLERIKPMTMTESGIGNNMPAPPVTPQADMQQLARDLKAELDRRDEEIRRTLTMLKDSITTLSNAIQKDEAWAQETRQVLEETRKQVHTLQMQGALPAPTGNNRQPAKTLPSPLHGMKIMSVEKGMAWIRWQGSAWAVREGDSLGNITITRIDPSSRAVITSAGTLR